MPARLAPWPQASRTTLVRCLWLAMLLHLWAVLWLGSAPEGTAPPGQGVQGRLNVTLRGPSDDGTPSAPPPQAGAATAAETPPRLGGRVRDTPLAPNAAPGAERLGPASTLPLPPVVTSPAPSPTPSLVPSLTPAPAPLPAQIPVPVPAPVPQPVPQPGSPTAQLGRMAPAPAAATALPEPVVPPAALPAPPAERQLEAGTLRRLLPSAAAPLIAPSPLPAPSLPALAPARLPDLAAALPPQAVAVPTPIPAPTQQPAFTASPTPAPTPARSPEPAAVDSPAVTGPATAVARPAPPAPGDSGPRVGADIAVPATAASAPKRLNLELGRLRGGELSRHGTAGVLPALPRPPETDKLAADIDKAGRADCRKAHAGAGILAVVPLAIDAVRGSGCKW